MEGGLEKNYSRSPITRTRIFPLTQTKFPFRPALDQKVAEIYPDNSNSGSLNSTRVSSH